MSYTVKIIDGKPWVVEVVGQEPSLQYVDGKLSPVWMIWRNHRDRAEREKKPTLPEHFAHWQALEGKEFDEGSFTIVDAYEMKYVNLYDTPHVVPSIPQPNEDEWAHAENELLQVFCAYGNDYFDDNTRVSTVITHLKTMYTLSKK